MVARRPVSRIVELVRQLRVVLRTTVIPELERLGRVVDLELGRRGPLGMAPGEGVRVEVEGLVGARTSGVDCHDVVDEVSLSEGGKAVEVEEDRLEGRGEQSSRKGEAAGRSRRQPSIVVGLGQGVARLLPGMGGPDRRRHREELRRRRHDTQAAAQTMKWVVAFVTGCGIEAEVEVVVVVETEAAIVPVWSVQKPSRKEQILGGWGHRCLSWEGALDVLYLGVLDDEGVGEEEEPGRVRCWASGSA